MSVILGSGDYTYRVVEGWGRLPDGWEFGDVAAVGIDGRIESMPSIEGLIRWSYSTATGIS